MTQSDTIPLNGLILLAALTLFWGFNWPFMKIALNEVPVWWFRSYCLLFGGTGLLVFAKVTRQVIIPIKHEIRPLLYCVLFNVLGWHLCSAYGVTLIPAGRAVIIAFMMPIWASILGSLFLNEPLTKTKITALLLGLFGLGVLIGPDLISLQSAPTGVLCMLAASISWACGTVIFKKTNWISSTLALAGWQLIIGGLPIIIVAIFYERSFDPIHLSSQAYYALGYVLALPMIFCQWAYLKSVRTLPASLAAISTLGIPVVGIFSSALILDENIGYQEFASLVLICSALGAVLVLPTVRKNTKLKRQL
jgi:drug/metabolite transporter (DMT)-like permease